MTRPRKYILDNFIDTPLVYRKVCINGHCGPDGRNVKLPGRNCLACDCRMPKGPYTQVFKNVSEPEPPAHWKYKTDEEKKLARSRASMRWAEANKDKAVVYKKKYYEKPGVKEQVREKAREKYNRLSPEQKKKIVDRARERYHERKKEITE